jgi:putative transposase
MATGAFKCCCAEKAGRRERIWSTDSKLKESLQLRSKLPRRRKMVVTRRDPYVPKRPNQAWSMDFVSDQLVNGQRIRALTVVDVFTREALAVSVGYRLRADDVVELCNRLVA